MVGAALSQMWATNPKLAFVCHPLVTLMIGLLFVAFLSDRNNWTVTVILGIGFFIETATLVWFTHDAIGDRWAPFDR